MNYPLETKTPSAVRAATRSQEHEPLAEKRTRLEDTTAPVKVTRPELIGSTVEKALDASLWRLVSGEIGLQDVTPALAAWYSVGHHDGIASCRATIERAEQDADRMYVQAFNPKDRAKLIRERQHESAEAYWAQFVVNGGAL